MKPNFPFLILNFEGVVKEKDEIILPVETKRGEFVFRILPSRVGQTADYEMTIVERNGEIWGEIYTREFDLMKRGEVSDEMLIKLYHEVTHGDERVICPLNSALRMYREKHPDVFRFHRFENYMRIENLMEDVLSVPVLTFYFEREDIIKTLRISKNRLILRESFQSLYDFSGDVDKKNYFKFHRLWARKTCISSDLKEIEDKILQGKIKWKSEYINRTFSRLDEFFIFMENLEFTPRLKFYRPTFLKWLIRRPRNYRSLLSFVEEKLRMCSLFERPRWEMEKERIQRIID
jgi:hypothetical protein